MNPRAPNATLVLLLIALGLGLWVWWSGGDAPLGGAEGEPLVPLEIDEVTALELPLKDGGSARLVRGDDGSWSLASPVAYPAAADAVADVLRGVTGLETQARLDDVGDERGAFGLGPDSERLVVESEERSFVVRIGRDTPFGGNRYVAIEGDDPVWAVPGWKLDQLRRELRTLRDATMFELEADRVQSLRIELDGAPLAAARRIDGAWVLTEPFAEPADQDTITRLVEDLELARATGFVDAPGAPAEYGLEAPSVVIELGFEGEERTRLEMGGAGEQRYLRVAGRPQIFEIATRIADGVPRSVFRLRDRQVLRVDEGEIAGVALAFPREGRELAFSREEDGWKAQDAEEPFDETRLEDLVYTLSDLDAVEIPAPETPPGDLGLEPARVRVELRDAKGEALASLELGDPVPGTGIGARSSQKERLWIVDEEVGAVVPLGLEAFRNRWSGAEDGE